AESLAELSRLYLALGDQDGAWAYAEQAMSLQIEDHRAQSRIFRQAGRIALELNYTEDAVEAFQTAISLLSDAAPAAELSALDTDLAQAEMALGRLDAAQARLLSNIEQLDATVFPAAAARAQSILGEIVFLQGDADQAIQWLNQALSIQRRIGAQLAELETLERLSRVQQSTEPTQAISTNDRALTLLDQPQLRNLPEVRRAGFRNRYRELYERQIALLVDANQTERAWAVGERVRAQDWLNLDDERTRSQQGAHSAQALNHHAQLLAALHALTLSANPDTQNIQRIRSELDRLELDLQPRSKATADPSLEAARAVLKPDQRLLSFVLGPDHGWVWIIERAHVQVHELNDVAGLRADVEELLTQLRHPRNALGRVNRLLANIHGRLSPAVHTAVDTANELFIQPDRELYALPFSLLWPGSNPEQAPKPIRRVVSATPGITSNLNNSDTPRSMLVLADPGWNNFTHEASRYPESSLLARLTRESVMARLPGSRREAEAIVGLNDADVRVQLTVGPAASRRFVMNGGMHGHQLLHIATHGLVDLVYPELSALLLADEHGVGPAFLRPSDIAQLNLNASLVVLSGCDTGLGRVFAGNGAFSLARPFLMAGADQVIASLWKIDDHRTALFMTRFYQNLLIEAHSPATALAQTKQWIRQQPGYSHPYYWAGFILTSEKLINANDSKL
ncbi:MAG: CHAT domain-containing protein, partial [Pseudomonadota bacterium]